MARPVTGQRFWVLFDRTEGLWHERLCLHVHAAGAIILTPDGDVYSEEWTDYTDLLVSGPMGGIPRRLYPCQRYGFDPADLERDSEAREYADVELRRLLDTGRYPAALPPAAPVPLPGAVADGADGGAPGGALVPAGGGTATPRVLPDALDYGERGSEWYLLADAFGQAANSKVTVGVSDELVVGGGFGLLIRGSETAPVSLVAPARGTDDDVRTLAVRYNPRGERTRSFASARDAFTEEPFTDFPVRGPRTTGWLLEAFHQCGQGPVARHHWWRQMLGVTTADPGVDEHLFLSELFELGSQYDQLNLPNSAAFEAAARRYQLWEERYGEKLKQVTEGSGAAAGVSAERHIFLGVSSGKAALISPDLAQWVADKMEQESKILKERRKGREERNLAALAAAGTSPPAATGLPTTTAMPEQVAPKRKLKPKAKAEATGGGG